MENNYGKKVTLYCPVCGGTQFEYDDEIDIEVQDIKCVQCNKIFTKNELVDANSGNIEREIKFMGEDILKKELKKSGFKLK